MQVIFYMTVMLFAFGLVGCNQSSKGDTETETETQEEKDAKDNLFVVVENDMAEESLTLYSYASGMEHYYEYSFSTQFYNKYGDYAPASEFTSGRVVTIGNRDNDGYLTEVRLSDEVWEYEKIKRFSVNEMSGVLTIADTKYSLQDKVYVFSNGERITYQDISEDDILTVVGMDKKILSIIVTTGHGTLSLNNTTLFEDSYLQLNNDIFALITEDMDIELPEGRYVLKVANDGWGGTTEIEIVRGETTEVDLDTLKGAGKQTGFVTFKFDVDDVEVYIDNELVDHSQTVGLTYGTHVLKIKAEGYDTVKKYLYVNSAEAIIEIELSDDESSESETEETQEEETETETETEE